MREFRAELPKVLCRRKLNITRVACVPISTWPANAWEDRTNPLARIVYELDGFRQFTTIVETLLSA